MRLAVVTLGSAGDLHPYLAIAREMRRRGHQVYFFSQAPHRAAVEAEGLRFTAIASERDHERTLRHPGLWHPIRGFGVLWRHLCVPAIRPTIDALAALASDDLAAPLTVLASPLAVGARLLREARPGFRLLTAYTAPSALRSRSEPMFLGAWRVPAWVPGVARAGLWRALDAWKLEPMARAALSEPRSLLALGPQQGSTFGQWIHSPDGGLAMFPRWFAAAQPDWPVEPAFAGFPVYEPGLVPSAMDARLARFLEGEAPPVVVNAGSAAFAGWAFLERALVACRSLGRRCVLLSAYAEQWPAMDDDHHVLALPSAQLCTLLPRAAALIHHGGIGTCAQALAAHTPQLVLPAAYDQFDNGFRVAQGGWGLAASSQELNSHGLTGLLATLLARPDHASAETLSPLDIDSEWPTASFSESPNIAVQRACEILAA